jgi:tripartite-type tricarboxylate transporter receptor subunit TctC
MIFENTYGGNMDRKIFWKIALLLSTVSLSAFAQSNFPDKPIKTISAYAAGGGPDVQLRQVSPY